MRHVGPQCRLPISVAQEWFADLVRLKSDVPGLALDILREDFSYAEGRSEGSRSFGLARATLPAQQQDYRDRSPGQVSG